MKKQDFETYHKRFRDFEILTTFSETHVEVPFATPRVLETQDCQPPTSSNIENWWERDNRWRDNARTAHYVIYKKKREKDVVGTVTFDVTGFLPTIILLLILQWPTGDCEETFDVTSKIAQTTQNIWNNILTQYWLICWSSCRPTLRQLWVDIQCTISQLMSTDIMTDPAKDWNFRFKDLKCKGKDCEMHTAHSHLKCKHVCFVCFPFQVLNASPLRNFCQFSFQLEEKHQPTLPLKVL